MKAWWKMRLLDEATDAPQGSGDATPAGQDDSSTTDFSDVLSVSESDSDEVVEEKGPEPVAASPAQPKPGTEPAKPTPPPAPAPAQATPPVAPAPATVAQQPQATQQPSAPTAPAATVDPAVQFQQARAQLVSDIEQKYQLSEADATAMLTEPEKVMPKLVANLFVDVYEAVFRQITGQLPQLFQTMQHQHQAADETRRAFYEKWPALNRPELQAQVNQLAQQYMALNPKASRDEAFQEIGQLAHVRFKIPFPEQAAAQAPPAAAPARPFTPANPGASAMTAPAKPQKNFYEQLAEEFEPLD